MAKKLPTSVHATYTNTNPTYQDFLRNAHPAPHPRPIIPQRNFFKLTTPTEKPGTFVNIGRSGTSAIGKRSTDKDQP